MTPSEIRQSLIAAGFNPTPLNGKKPVLKEWQRRTEASLGDIDIWSKLYPHATNTGVLTRHAPALDIDIMEPDAAAAVEEMARERFGEHGAILVRFGQPPKRAIPLQTDEPFDKILRLFTAPGGSEQKIEVLASGQQIVAAGVHPDTRKPYSWHGGELWSIRRDALPLVHEADMRAFVDAAALRLVNEFGFTSRGAGKGKSNGSAPPVEWRELVKGVAEGARDCSAAKLAGYLLRRRVDPFVVLELLQSWNTTRCTPPLPGRDIERIVGSIAGKELRRRLSDG
jgi:hypothetical protein